MAYHIITEQQPPLERPERPHFRRKASVTFRLPQNPIRELTNATAPPVTTIQSSQHCPSRRPTKESPLFHTGQLLRQSQLLGKMPSTIPLTRRSSTNVLPCGLIRSDPGPLRTFSLYDIPEHNSECSADEDSMTLAQRRNIILRQQSVLRHQSQEVPLFESKKSAISLLTTGLEKNMILQRNTSTFDAVKSESRLTRWREDLAHALSPQVQQKGSDEAMVIAMSEERRAAHLTSHQKERNDEARSRALDARMRSKTGLESHRKAMSRLQAKIGVT